MVTGKLSVHLGSNSVFLGRNVPIEVRDSSMRLVHQTSSEQLFELPVGLYQVSAVLEDGRRHSALVQIEQGNQSVALDSGGEASKAKAFASTPRTGPPRYERPRFTRSIMQESEAGLEPGLTVPVQFLEARGAQLQRQTRTSWILACDPHIEVVPTALFKVGDRKVQISLPISPAGDTPSSLCAVKIDGTHAEAWISPERTVANAMQNMLASGYVLQAARVANDAANLLRDKYDDPAGAALGGLILHKAGLLQNWQSWVENLVQDFGWLPDGKVILAALLFNDDARRGRALNLALEASSQRMLFTESHSLLLDLLRRWPRDAERDQRYEGIYEGISRMAAIASYIDWEAICLTYTLNEDD